MQIPFPSWYAKKVQAAIAKMAPCTLPNIFSNFLLYNKSPGSYSQVLILLVADCIPPTESCSLELPCSCHPEPDCVAFANIADFHCGKPKKGAETLAVLRETKNPGH